MLFLLFGSSGAGKSFALDELRGRIARLAVHDFDEVGVPPGADTAWRHRANEQWVRRALDYQAAGTDVLLAGQTPSENCSPRLRRPSWKRSQGVSSTAMTRHGSRASTHVDANGSRAPAGRSGIT